MGYLIKPEYMSDEAKDKMRATALSKVAEFWKEQAELLGKQANEWHEVALFCRRIKESLRKKWDL